MGLHSKGALFLPPSFPYSSSSHSTAELAATKRLGQELGEWNHLISWAQPRLPIGPAEVPGKSLQTGRVLPSPIPPPEPLDSSSSYLPACNYRLSFAVTAAGAWGAWGRTKPPCLMAPFPQLHWLGFRRRGLTHSKARGLCSTPALATAKQSWQLSAATIKRLGQVCGGRDHRSGLAPRNTSAGIAGRSL